MKKQMKRLLILIIFACCLIVTSCDSKEKPTVTESDTPNLTNSFTGEETEKQEGGRAIVTISALAADTQIQNAIVAFNQENSDYAVEILEMKSGQSVTEYKDREELALSTQKGPDLFTDNLDVSFASYVEKGIMEDLMPYVERDLHPEDYLECSLYAYAKEGKLYALEPGFVVTTLVGDETLLGQRTGWSFEEMKELMAANPQITLFQNEAMEPGEFLRTYLFQGGSSYTDFSTLREVIDFDKKNTESLPSHMKAIPGENVMVVPLGVDDPLDLVDCEMLYGKKLVPIGYVNKDRRGIYHEGIALSINSASEQKEGAWAFLKFLLSEEYQREYGKGFSPLKVVFEEKLAYYVEPVVQTVYLEDLEEEIIVTQKHRLPRSGIEIESLSPEQIEKVRNLVLNSCSNCFQRDETAAGIIWEEAADYYQDRRSLESVMETLQNRMELYCEEAQLQY